MDKDFQKFLTEELQYLRDSMDSIKEGLSKAVPREEYEQYKAQQQTNAKTIIGWIIGVYLLVITSILTTIGIFHK